MVLNNEYALPLKAATVPEQIHHGNTYQPIHIQDQVWLLQTN